MVSESNITTVDFFYSLEGIFRITSGDLVVACWGRPELLISLSGAFQAGVCTAEQSVENLCSSLAPNVGKRSVDKCPAGRKRLSTASSGSCSHRAIRRVSHMVGGTGA
jgi:hypothetical protein